jgi:hypothetical protein
MGCKWPIRPLPLPKFYGYLCLYQTFKVAPFVRNQGYDNPLMNGTRVISYDPLLMDFSKKSTPFNRRATFYPLWKDQFQEIGPFIRENMIKLFMYRRFLWILRVWVIAKINPFFKLFLQKFIRTLKLKK